MQTSAFCYTIVQIQLESNDLNINYNQHTTWDLFLKSCAKCEIPSGTYID